MYQRRKLKLTAMMAAISVLPSCSTNETCNNLLPVEVEPPSQEQNILTEADPTIFMDTDSTYYLYGTGSQSDKGFLVYHSNDLKTWEGPVGRNGGFCLTGETSFGTMGFWAPQVMKRNDTYYMFYTANEQIAVAMASSPQGPFSQNVKKMIEMPCKAIDPYVFIDSDGKAYLYHVRLQNGNRIFVAEMTDDLMNVREETATECISATEEWENTQHVTWGVTEGPTVLHIGDTYYMFYSANDFRNIDYAVGIATASSPYGPWIKSDYPVINRANIGRYGTGHGDMFKDAQGHWNYVFHTHNSLTEVSPRKTALVEMIQDAGTFTIKAGSFYYLYKK